MILLVDLASKKPSPAYKLGKATGHNTFPFRESLKALGLEWDAESKTWTTDSAGIYEAALFIVTGKKDNAPKSDAASEEAPGAEHDLGNEPDPDATGGDEGGTPYSDALGKALFAVGGSSGERAEGEAQGDTGEPGDLTANLSDSQCDKVLRSLKARFGTPIGDLGRDYRQNDKATGKPGKYGREDRSAVESKRERIKEQAGDKAAELIRQALSGDDAGDQGDEQDREDNMPEASKKPASSATKPESDKKAKADAEAQQVFGPAGVQAIKSLVDAADLDENKVAEIARREAFDLDKKLASITQAYVDDKLAKLDLASSAPVNVTVKIGELAPVDATGMHFLATKVAALLHVGLNVALVGEPGAGKTHLLHDCAKLLGRDKTGAISLSAGVTESSLTGRVLPIGEGRYLTTPFVDIYENGGLFLFDELDAADPNVLLVVNAALANSGFYIEARTISGLPAWVARHPQTGMLAGLNTAGTGGDSRFTGRQALDAATVDRWYRINFPFDNGIIGRLFGAKPKAPQAPWKPCDLPLVDSERQAWADWFHNVKARLDSQKSRFSWTPRVAQRVTLARQAGCSPKEVLGDLLAFAKPAELDSLGELARGPRGVTA